MAAEASHAPGRQLHGGDMVVWENRPSWGRHIEFMITCVGSAVGLGNVWRFPPLVYSNGGGAFFIPYVISLFLVGIPLLGLELIFGQFATLGPLTIWEINPMFKGIGMSLTFITAFISIYYNVIIAQALYFVFASFTSDVPWKDCGHAWNTCSCRTPYMNLTLPDPMLWYGTNGLNCTGKEIDSGDWKSPSEEYYYNKVLELTEDIEHLGLLKWDLTLCNLLAWVIVCGCIIKGVKSIGKVSYFFALCPYLLLTVLVIKGLSLEGAGTGISFYLTPNVTVLAEAEVWEDAASQILFSLSCAMGVMPCLASYNNFKNNILKDSMFIAIINCLTSFYAGFAIFSVLGYMAVNSGKEVKDVTKSGPGLAFVAYPQALAELPLTQLWSILFFCMMAFLGLSSQYPLVETVLTSIQDEFPRLRNYYANMCCRFGICFLFFLLGLPQTTQGGMYVLEMTNSFIDFPLLIAGLLEFLVIVHIYGIDRLTEDVFLMVGYSKFNHRLYHWYYVWNFRIFAPFIIVFIFIFDAATYKPIISEQFPPWVEVLGWLQVTFIMMWVPIWYCYKYFTHPEHSPFSWTMCKKMNQPTARWGPAKNEYRTLPRYQEYLTHMSINPEMFNIKNGEEEEDAENKETNAKPFESFQSETCL